MKRIVEISFVTVILIAIVRFLYSHQHLPFIGEYYAVIFAVLFLYVPVFVLWLEKKKVDFIDTSFSGYTASFLHFLMWVLIIFPPYLIAAHFWETIIYGKVGFRLAAFPDLWKTILFQVLLIALPEEFYFRGYMQGKLNDVWQKRWRFLGANVGWAWPITAVIFAFAHSFVNYQWWHFSIFFPALLFGWLRERTGSITAGALFHAMSNIVSDYIARSYY